MKKLFLIIALLTSINFAQSSLLTLFDDGASFLPTDQSGLLAWYDFSDLSSLTLSGANINVATDKSGLQGGATPVANACTTKTGQNGLSVCDFAGTAGTLRDANFSGFTDVSNQFSVYVVAKLNTTSGECFIEMSDNGSSNRGFLLFAETNTLNLRPDGGNAATGAYTDVTNYKVFSFIHAPASRDIYINGSLFDNDANTQNMIAVPTIMTIGALADGATYSFDGEMGEILIYLGAHTEAQREQIETYLNDKWAIY